MGEYDEKKNIVEESNVDNIKTDDIKNQEKDDNIVSNSEEKKPNKDRSHLKKVITTGVVFGIVVGVVFQGVNLATRLVTGQNSSLTGNSTKIESTKTTSGKNSKESSVNTVNVVKQCMPSIVSITNMSIQEVQGFESFFWGNRQPQQYKSTSVGSGIIVGQNDSQLLIATNNHVVEGAETLTVTLYNDDENPVTATLKGTDEEKDLAVVAINTKDIKPETLNNIKVATLGDSTSIEVGEQAIAIGNALGYGQSVTEGIISAKDRAIDETQGGNDSEIGQDQIEQSAQNAGIKGKFIQTDAAINPGNSGGALLNSKGEVIGINTAKIVSSSAESMGYAIPITEASPIINDLMNQKTREIVDASERGALGIKCIDVDSATAKAYGMPKGILVSEVVKDSAAEKAGLQKSDIIIKIDGSSITNTTSLQSKLSYYKAGEKAKITYSRMDKNGEYQEADVEVTLEKQTSYAN